MRRHQPRAKERNGVLVNALWIQPCLMQVTCAILANMLILLRPIWVGFEEKEREAS